MHVECSLRHAAVEDVHIQADERRGSSVVVAYKLKDGDNVIVARIPQHSRNYVHLQLIHIPTRAAVRSFLKDTLDAVSGKEANVGTQHIPIGEGHDVVGKVGDVIPDI